MICIVDVYIKATASNVMLPSFLCRGFGNANKFKFLGNQKMGFGNFKSSKKSIPSFKINKSTMWAVNPKYFVVDPMKW